MSGVGDGPRDIARFLKMLGRSWHDFPIDDEQLGDISQWARQTFTPEEYAALKRISQALFAD
ncbi:hypothetical protein SCB29_33855 [Paraburkholderia sp. SIMBA_055]